MRTSTVTRRGILQGSAAAALFSTIPVAAQEAGTPVAGDSPRARDLGVPFLGGAPGPHNAITDVSGVGVGHVTLVDGDGPLSVGAGPVRAGVTAVVPRLADPLLPVFAGRHILNGNGEMTGGTLIDEMGMLYGPVMLTGTFGVGDVKTAVEDIAFGQFQTELIPVVAETHDGLLNDAHGHHVKFDHVLQAYVSASDGPVAEGNVGGGTPMVAHDFKGGIGTASRVIPFPEGVSYTVGVLVQANHGIREALTIAGVPVGLEITDLLPEIRESARGGDSKTSSIIVIVATDAPFLPHQLKRLAQRAGLGIGITGGRGEDPSGNLFLAFSTAPLGAMEEPFPVPITMLPNFTTSPFFHQVAAATEEAIVNAMVAAETMTGRDGNTVYALPHDRLQEALQKYNRLVE